MARFINPNGATLSSSRLLPVKAGQTWRTLDGAAAGSFSGDAHLPVMGKVDSANGKYAVLIFTGDPDIYPDTIRRLAIVLVESSVAWADLIAAPTPAVPEADCAEAIAADRLRARIVYE